MRWRLEKKDLPSFFQSLMEAYDLIAPVRLAHGVTLYQKIDRPEQVDLAHPNPQKPAKETFFPQSEVLFRYEKVNKETSLTPMQEVGRKRILFGARPCDIEAIAIIEKPFMDQPHTDVYFAEKREKSIIMGMGCSRPLSTCFCSSTGGGPFRRAGSDVFFVDLGEAYLVELLTDKGKAFEKNPLLKEADPKEVALAKEVEEKAIEKVDSSVPVEGIVQRLDLMAESPFWDRVHEPCVGCRICTYLCPTCHCFDIVDEGDSRKGQRVRNWDSCLSPLYSLETSGHNPRPTARERMRQRLMHKFNYYPKLFGQVACVGCGRCILHCPVHFDIRKAIFWTSPRGPKRSDM